MGGIIAPDFINEKGKDLHSILAGKAPAHSLLHEITCALDVGCESISQSSPSSFSSESLWLVDWWTLVLLEFY